MSDVTLHLLIAGLAFAAGGILKGATGAGAPVLIVPILAVFYGVQAAVALFTVSNLISNFWQGWQYRTARLPGRFVGPLVVGGAAGAGIGSYMLASLSPDLLMVIIGGVVVIYIVFRLTHPGWTLAYHRAAPLAGPVGVLAGMMQGASGISAPVSLTYLSAMRLERPQFIATISVFFFSMAAVQIPMLFHYGILTPQRFGLSALAMLPMVAAMPVGGWLARHVSREVFDRLILALLAVIAVKLFHDGLF